MVYNPDGKVIKITIEEGYKKLDTYKFSIRDDKRKKIVLKLLKQKWGVDLSRTNKLPEDLAWLKQKGIL